MAGALLSLSSLAAAAACLFAGTFLPAPGDGQNLSSIPPSAVSPFMSSHSEGGNLSSWTTAPTVTTVDGNITVTSNASNSSLPETQTPTTLDSLNTIRPLNTTSVTDSSIGTLSLPTATATLMEGNQNRLDDETPINTTSLVSSSTNFTATETSQPEAQGSTIVPQPQSSTFTILGLTEKRPESIPVTDHEAITDEGVRVSLSTSDATSPVVPVLNASGTVTLSPGFVSNTLTAHRVTPVETEQPVNPVQKSSAADAGDDEDLPSMSEASAVSEDPLVIAVIFVFTVTVGILALMGFLRYRQHSSRLQFRRLQDLPMDDMMEDTPLSLYSY